MQCFLQTRLTMKKNLIFLLVVLMVGLIISCHKEPQPNNEQTIDSITFGDYEWMSVTPYDSTFHPEQYGHFSWGNAIDLNNDGQDDIQFHSMDVGSAGLGHDIVTTLKCQHSNIALLGDIIQQEHFLHIDTTDYYTIDSTSWDVGIYRVITCSQISETDSILSHTEKLSIYANNVGESFDINNTFMSTDVLLKNRSYTIPYGSETVGNVTYHYMEEIKNDCDFFPMDEEKYIGFKVTENGKNRLGWMKIILHHDYVELLEIAIQNKNS